MIRKTARSDLAGVTRMKFKVDYLFFALIFLDKDMHTSYHYSSPTIKNSSATSGYNNYMQCEFQCKILLPSHEHLCCRLLGLLYHHFRYCSFVPRWSLIINKCCAHSILCKWSWMKQKHCFIKSKCPWDSLLGDCSKCLYT